MLSGFPDLRAVMKYFNIVLENKTFIFFVNKHAPDVQKSLQSLKYSFCLALFQKSKKFQHPKL